MKTTIQRITSVVLLVTTGLIISGCNTMEGVGEDTERAGESIQREVNESR